MMGNGRFFKQKTFKFIDSSGNQYYSSEPGKFGGHSKLKIYGRLDCPSALRWLAKGYYGQHRVFFLNEEDAVQVGYRPCAVCLRTEYKLYKK